MLVIFPFPFVNTSIAEVIAATLEGAILPEDCGEVSTTGTNLLTNEINSFPTITTKNSTIKTVIIPNPINITAVFKSSLILI